MTEKEFEVSLKEIPFPAHRYKELGLSKDFIDRTLARCSIKKKSLRIRTELTDDPLVRLVQNYDLLDVEIGMITFNSEVSETDDFFIIGGFDIDMLGVSKTTKEVVVLSHEKDETFLYDCSQNGAMFLEAVIAGARFLENCAIDVSLSENQKVICLEAESCIEIAGGSKYLNFYKVLLGCNS